MTNADYQDCPYCAEKIIKGAKKCKHCYSLIIDEQNSIEEAKAGEKDDLQNEEETIKNESLYSDFQSKDESDVRSDFEENNAFRDTYRRMEVDTQYDNLNTAKVDISESSRNTPLTDKPLATSKNEGAGKMEERKGNFKSLAWVSYILSGIFISLGFYKMFAYSNPDSPYATYTNVYVGGDAYNYIINANYATAYFALAIFCAVIGLTAVIGYLLTSQEAGKILENKTEIEIVKQEELL